MWDFYLNWCSRLGELTKKLKIPRAFSFLVISFKLMDWLSWIYQISLLVLCKMNPENFSLIGSIVQEYFVKNEKLRQTRLWHHQYMRFKWPCLYMCLRWEIKFLYVFRQNLDFDHSFFYTKYLETAASNMTQSVFKFKVARCGTSTKNATRS